MTQNKDFFSIKETADKLGVHWQTIYRWIHSGKIPGLETTPSGRYHIPRKWVEDQKWAEPVPPLLSIPE
jgi:excisionase family DNA binding protein